MVSDIPYIDETSTILFEEFFSLWDELGEFNKNYWWWTKGLFQV